MKPINIGGHAAYQKRVLTQLRKYYPDAAHSLPASTWEIMEKFWCLDLSEVDLLMWDRYSNFGPAPRLPSDMLRSILLSVEFKVTSYTKWSADLKENHLHAILSGFPVGDTPGTGTFYDFQSRLWLSEEDNLSPKARSPKEKPQKPKKEGEKAPPVEKLTVKDLFEKFEQEPPQDMNPCLRLFQIFKELFLLRSDRTAWSASRTFPSPVTAHLFTLLRRNGKSAPVTAWKKGYGTVNVTVSTASPTVTSDGIPIGNGSILAMTCTCSRLRTRKTTCPSSPSSGRPQGMIPSGSFITGIP